MKLNSRNQIGNHFFALGMEPHFRRHSGPSRLSLGCFPQLASHLLHHCPSVVALSLKVFFHAPRHTYAVLPVSSLTVQFATSPLNLSPAVQTLLRPCRLRKFMMPLLRLSWLVPERSLGNGFAFAEEKVTAPAAGGRRSCIT